MKKKMIRMAAVVLGAAITVVLSGCSSPRISETGRTAVEQFLLSTVIERGIGCADFSAYNGKKVFIEYDYLAPQVDKPYIQSAFELQLAKNGVIVSRDVKDSELIIQIGCGVLATDTNNFTIGTPALPFPF